MTVGSFCLVLHSHLPWLAHHGSWPVGEEWLHQAWAMSYDRVVTVLERLADRGRRDLLTLGVTPVLAAQLDDPYCLDRQRVWLNDWYWRAVGRSAAAPAGLGPWEAGQARRAIESFEQRWRHGGSPVIRRLVDAGTVELLGGPLTHPFQPMLAPEVASFALETGLQDARIRFGRTPIGIWAPECGYRDGIADLYADAGIGHFLLDGPTLAHVGSDTHTAHPIGDRGVLGFGRDLDVTYRVWSPRRGYPGGKWYRDFHTFDHEWGFRHSRVTSASTSPADKAPYDHDRALRACSSDADDFVTVVRDRLERITDARGGRPGLVVAAYDTELFGHWWYEGPEWLEQILTRLPEAGVTVTTLRGAIDAGLVGDPVRPTRGSWGKGKDWHIWEGDRVADMVADNAAAQALVTRTLKDLPTGQRSAVADQLTRDLLLALASDWAFMVSHDSAAGYARDRHRLHHWALAELADSVDLHGWDSPEALELAAVHRAVDGPFGHIDARSLG